MRTLRTKWAAAWLLMLAPAPAATAAETSVKDLLVFKPNLKGVEYDTPTDPAAIAACKVEKIPGGFILRDGQGKILLRLLDRDGNGRLDQWGYYQDGFEVYRELDHNNDRGIDEVRYLNAGGTRVGKVVGGKVVSWTRISAEESSRIFVQALVAGDLEQLELVMASPAELAALGVPKGEIDQVAAAEKQRLAQVKAIRAGVTASGWDANTIWLQLQGGVPHLIPADTGVKDDVFLYENAVIFAGPANNGANNGRLAFLQVGEMVKVGDAWKFVDLPRVIDPNKNAVITAIDGGIRSWVYRNNDGAPGGGGGEDPRVAEAMQALAAYDKANEPLLNSGTPKDVARFHVGRYAPLKNVAEAAKAAGDAKLELDHLKSSVDSLAAAYTSGAYPAGAKALDDLAGKGGKVATYAAFKRIEADFSLQNDQGGNVFKVQKDWLASLGDFIEKHPQCDEAPQALLFLASTNEMNGDEDVARKYYARLVEQFPATDPGKMGAGAIRRLDLVGKPIAFKGATTRGQTVDAAQYRGKYLLIDFWATMAAPAKRDLPELAKLYQKYNAKGFEVVAVSLDNDRADLDAFLKANPMPWPEVFEPGGMTGRLAAEFGVISLPTILLVGPDGTVIHRGLRTAGEVEILLDKTLAAKVTLGNK